MEIVEETDWRDGDIKDQIQWMFTSGLHSDVTIRHQFDGEEKVYRVHSIFLTMASPVFETMFQNENFNSKTITIKDVNGKIIDLFLKYIYQHKLELDSVEETWSLYYLGEKYMMGKLKKTCLDRISDLSNFDNFCTNYEMSKLFNLPEMAHYNKWEIILNLAKIIENENFMKLSQESILELLDETELGIRELDLFVAVTKWFENFQKSEENVKKSIFEEFNIRVDMENDNSDDFEDELIADESSESKNDVGIQTSSAPSRPELLEKILAKIFFRDMTPKEFVQVTRTGILTLEESHYVLMNLINDEDELYSWPDYFRNCSRRDKEELKETVFNIPFSSTFFSEISKQICQLKVSERIYLTGIEVSLFHVRFKDVLKGPYHEEINIKVSNESTSYTETFKTSHEKYKESMDLMFETHMRIEKDSLYEFFIDFGVNGLRKCLKMDKPYSIHRTQFTFVPQSETDTMLPVTAFRFCKQCDYFYIL